MKTMSMTHQVAVTVEAHAIRVKIETLVMTSDDDAWPARTRRNSRSSSTAQAHSPTAPTHDAAKRRQKPRTGRKVHGDLGREPALVLDPIIIVEEPPTGPAPTP
jgi:hypothetical protein